VSVACHPKHPSLVACGSYNGEVLLFDLSVASGGKASRSGSSGDSSGSGGGGGGAGSSSSSEADNKGNDDPLVFCSRVDDYFHREPVRSLAWVWDGDANDFSLASVSSDGKVRG
jgi:hypothetical protein